MGKVIRGNEQPGIPGLQRRHPSQDRLLEVATRLDKARRGPLTTRFGQQDILAVGREDSLCESNERLSALLWQKGVGNALRVWDGFAHDWPVWHKMLQLYIGGHD